MRIRNIFCLLLSVLILIGSSYSQVVDSTTLDASLHSGGYTTNLTLDSSKIYVLKGHLFIQSGANITIPSGTIIRGDQTTKGCLLISRGGKIFANGTSTRPIVFTSRKAPGTRAAGDWGGVILIGKATINTYPGVDSAIVEGIIPDVYYGGHDDNDNSGSMHYVRIEYAGVALSPNNEINGLSMYSVGRGTVIDHIMVSYSGDDGYEWFGGTVNLKYLIAFNSLDDDFDDSFGFRGRVQFVLAVRTPGIADASGSHTWESDNNEFVQGSSTLFNANSPRTQSFWSNFTSIGPKEFDTTTISSNFSGAIRERRFSLRSCWNGIFMGWNRGYRLDGPGCMNAANGDTIKFKSNIIAGISGNNWDTLGGPGTFNFIAWGMDPSRLNDTFQLNTQVMLANPYNPVRTTSNFIPVSGSPALTRYADPSTVDPFFDNVNYRGAFGTTDWSSAWANWRPDTVNYDVLIGIHPISTEVPSSYTISQNYPNPFNPLTNINFSLPKSGFVSLKVYNSLGEEIAKLVNEDLSIGTYKVDFDGTNLASGVYYYRISVKVTQGFQWTESKKMMLVK